MHVLRGVAANRSDKEIARSLGITVWAASRAIHEMKLKLGVTGGRIELVSEAMDRGIL